MSSSVPLHQALALVLAMAQSHVEDIETGLEEGLYVAHENEDLGKKQMAIAAIEQYLATPPDSLEKTRVCQNIVTDMVATYGDAVTKDEEINGGDAVDQLVKWVVQAQAALN
ncbi:MAG: hypothetical protein QMB52_09870 [Propionivibrio sp.]